MTAKAIYSAMFRNYADETSAGAYFNAAFVFVVAVALSTAQMGFFDGSLFDDSAYVLRLLWIAGTTAWALRMIYLADKEPDDRDKKKGRRAGSIASMVMIVGVLVS